jgi:Protein of unknown function (DUF3570)
MAWAEVVVAVTEVKPGPRPEGPGARRNERMGAIVAAALALPGVVGTARAENAPEHGQLSIKYLEYKDSQPGLERIKVSAPSIYLLLPVNSQWSVEGSGVLDSVSGASPKYHTAISSASKMRDERKAADIKVTHYAERSAYSMGLSASKEHDYRSTALSFDASFSSDDNNRTWNLGLGYAGDQVGSSNDKARDERKRTIEAMFGVTQALSATDLVQLNLTYSSGRCINDPVDAASCFSDPYKEADQRPHKRDQGILLARWNHHFEGVGATLRSSYRFYKDTYGINAHTFGAEWVQPVASMFTLTPSVRFYSQSAAKFYFDPSLVYDTNAGPPYPPGFFDNVPEFYSADQRLAAFGGVTVGLKLGVQFSPDWSADVKAERYEQRSNWRIGGTGSPGLDPFSASFVQLGLNKRF